MVDDRTDNMIQSYMKWTNQKTLKPEEFLLFRQQAVKEELAGIDTTPPTVMASQGKSNTSNVHHFSQEKKYERKMTERREPSPIPKDRSVEGRTEDNEHEKKLSGSRFGMSDSEFMEFMNSVED